MISQKYLITVFLVGFLTQRTFSQLSARQSSIDTLINHSYRLGLFNGNVLITDKGKEIYRKAIGYADGSRKTPLTDQYRFHIGSIAKEFNAVAIMMLKENWRLMTRSASICPICRYGRIKLRSVIYCNTAEAYPISNGNQYPATQRLWIR